MIHVFEPSQSITRFILSAPKLVVLGVVLFSSCVIEMPLPCFADNQPTDPSVTSGPAAASSVHVPQEIQRLHAPSYLNAVAWNFDGSRIAGLSGFGLNITVWDTKTWKVVNEFQNPGTAYAFNSLAFLPDGSILTTPILGKTPIFSLVQWNPETGMPVRNIPNIGNPPQLDIGITDTYVVSKDGSLIAGIGGKVGVMLFDSRSGQLIKALAVPNVGQYKDNAMSVAFSPDGQVLAIGTLSGFLHFYDLKSGSVLRTVKLYYDDASYIFGLAFSPGGKYIVAGKAKGQNIKNPDTIAAKILRVQDGELIASLPGSISKTFEGKEEAVPVRTVSWTPDNIVAVGDEVSLRLWHIDEARAKLVHESKMRMGTFKTAVSPQGLLAATDNNDIVIYQ